MTVSCRAICVSGFRIRNVETCGGDWCQVLEVSATKDVRDTFVLVERLRRLIFVVPGPKAAAAMKSCSNA